MMEKQRAKVAVDIACNVCEFVSEDLWATLVQDWGSIGQKGDLARVHG
jgi:hypothetical protein